MKAKEIAKKIIVDDRFVFTPMDMHRWWITYYKGPFTDFALSLFNSGITIEQPWNIFSVCEYAHIDEKAAEKIAESHYDNVLYFEIDVIDNEVKYWTDGWGGNNLSYCSSVNEIYDLVKKSGKAVIFIKGKTLWSGSEYIIEVRS